MPEIDGLETLKRLRKAEKELPSSCCPASVKRARLSKRCDRSHRLSKQAVRGSELEIAILKALDRIASTIVRVSPMQDSMMMGVPFRPCEDA